MKTIFLWMTVFMFVFSGFAQSTKVNNNTSSEKSDFKANNGLTIDFSKRPATLKDVEDNFAKGIEKFDLKDYKGAIEEFTKAIERNNLQYEEAYYNRGVSKYKLDDFNGAIEDYTKAIEVNPTYAKAYYNRGITKSKLGQTSGVCLDLQKAGELGYAKAFVDLKEFCK